MGMFVAAPVLALVLGLVLVVALFHLVFSLPLWLVVGGIALYLWYRGGTRRRWLGQGRRHGYLERRARW